MCSRDLVIEGQTCKQLGLEKAAGRRQTDIRVSGLHSGVSLHGFFVVVVEAIYTLSLCASALHPPTPK